jgi:nucleotide-binding universal stress UspA family protein
MKQILVASDFSKAAKNASLYAIELAKVTSAKIILFHSYHLPVPPVDIPVALDYRDLEEESVKRLEQERLWLDPKKELNIQCISDCGFADDNIIDLSAELKPDLIIMGMAKADKLTELILGSTTTALIKRSEIPVLIIPEKSTFSRPSNILFACDYNLDTVTHSLKPLKDFILRFNSRLFIVNLFKESDLSDSKKNIAEFTVENCFSDVEHSFHFEDEDDFVETITNFTQKHKIEMVALVPHKHNFFAGLFKENHTKSLAFHLDTPILAIPDRGSH